MTKTLVCLMVDDTDYPKRGIQTEMIGKVFSHVEHKMILGFKGLFLGITDGATQMLMDFCLVGEKGKKGRKYSRSLGCYYVTVDVEFAGRKVRLFFTKRNKKSDWNALITTNNKLEFKDAYRIYSMRWSLEVVFKESKGNLGLGKYQVRNFASQIACTAITAMQYNILATARRFSSYETIGGLFREVTRNSAELTITERIWGMIIQN